MSKLRALLIPVACLLALVATPALALDPIPTAPSASAPSEIVEVVYGHNIRVQGTPDFVKQSVAALDRLAELPSGAQTLEELGSTGRATVISETSELNAMAGALDDNDLIHAIVKHSGEVGPGTDAYVKWNPSLELVGTPAPLVLGHELIHALHVHRGELLLDRKPDGPNMGTKWEELRTIGIAGYEGEELTENGLRGEWNSLYPNQQIPAARNGHGTSDFGEVHPSTGEVPHAFEDPGSEETEEAPSTEPSSAPKKGILQSLSDWLTD